MKNKILIVIIASLFLLTGCTKTLTDRSGKVVKNEETETVLIENIICEPVNFSLRDTYRANGVDIKNMESCYDLKLLKWRGIWDTFFIYPVAWLFVKISEKFKNAIFAIILLSIISKLIEYTSAVKMAKQNKKLKALQPQVDEINKKYDNINDSNSLIDKGDELKKLYKENNIKPLTGIFTTILQIPILLAIIEVFYRVPILLESEVFGINLASSPKILLDNGNVCSLFLILFLIISAFSQSLIKTNNEKIVKKDLITAFIIMIIVFLITFKLPTGIAIYFLLSYLLGIIEKLIIKHKLSNE